MDKNSPVEKRFIFDCSAVALGAHLRRPTDAFIRSVASSCLPVTGGLAEATAAGQNFHDFIKFDSASTHVSGDYADPKRAVEFTDGNHGQNELPVNSSVQASITGLQIHAPADAGVPARLFVAKSLQVRLDCSSNRRDPVAYRSHAATFGDISIDGVPLKVHTATELFSQNETKEKLVKRYAEDADFRKLCANLFFPTGQSHNVLSAIVSRPEIPNSKGLIVGTVVTGLEWGGKKPDRADIVASNQLYVQGLGAIHFGEILIDENSRRLTLLRFQLGSGFGGDMSVCDAQSGGDTWPPT